MTREKQIIDIILAHDLYEQQIALWQKVMTKQVTLGDAVTQILALFDGYMSFEDVKGMIFEIQAKKCASCPKNKETE